MFSPTAITEGDEENWCASAGEDKTHIFVALRLRTHDTGSSSTRTDRKL